ncbi:hypothetical protein [Leisingera caerulea]|uniref:hypothetical protein n=1 Tax=Leisingera caerulea TaxID=506591 RepID=UPI003F4AE162
MAATVAAAANTFLKSFGHSFQKTLASAQQANGVVVAEDDDLIAVQHRMIAAAFNFGLQPGQANIAYDIAQFSPHDTALAGRLHIENLLHPQLRGNCTEHMCHAVSVRERG